MINSITNHSSVKAVGFYLYNTDVAKLLSYTYELLNNTFHLVKDSDMRNCALKAKTFVYALQPAWHAYTHTIDIPIKTRSINGKSHNKGILIPALKPDFQRGLKEAAISALASYAIMGLIEYGSGVENPFPIAFSAAASYTSIAHIIKGLALFSDSFDSDKKSFGCRRFERKQYESFHRITGFGPGDRIVQQIDIKAFFKSYFSQLLDQLIFTLRMPIDQFLPLGIGYLTYCAFPESNPMGIARMATETAALAALTPIWGSLTTLIDEDLWPHIKQFGRKYCLPEYEKLLTIQYLYKINDSNGVPVFPKSIIEIVKEYLKVEKDKNKWHCFD